MAEKNNGNLPLKIKIPFKASCVLIKELEKRGNYATLGNGYNTNQKIKVFAFYFALKSMIPSGKIRNYRLVIDDIKRITNLTSEGSFYARLKESEKYELIKIIKPNLQLCSWEKSLKILGIKDTSFNKIKFVVLENYLKVPNHYLIDLANEFEQQYFIKKAITKKIYKNVNIFNYLKSKNVRKGALAEALFHFQKESFLKPNIPQSEYDLLHSINACWFRSTNKFRNERYNGETRATFERIARLKRIFCKTKICKVFDVTLLSEGNARPNKFYYCGYDMVKKKTIWYLPTHIVIKGTIE